MKWLFFAFPVLAFLNVTGCSESRTGNVAASSAPNRQVDPDLDKLQGTWRFGAENGAMTCSEFRSVARVGLIDRSRLSER
jgi:hypothetical protein